MALIRFLGEPPRRRETRHKVKCRAVEKEFGVGKIQIPLAQWLEEAKLHPELAKDVAERFGDVPQQARSPFWCTCGGVRLKRWWRMWCRGCSKVHEDVWPWPEAF